MDSNTKKPSGLFKPLSILLCVLLVVSIVLNVVLYLDKNSLTEQVDTLTESNAGLTAELETTTGTAEVTAQDLLSANQTIARLTEEATEASNAIASLQADVDVLQAEYNTYQTNAEANLAAAIQKGEDDVKAAQDAADETIASLQAELDVFKSAATPVPQTPEPTEAPAAADENDTLLADDAVVATVNGTPVTGKDVLANYDKVVSYYGEPTADTLELYYAVAMREAVALCLINTAAAEMGLDTFTQEELDELNASADSEWELMLDDYVSDIISDRESASEESLEAAYTEAEAFFASMGYSRETLRQSYLQNERFERIQAELCKDVAVTDDEVLAYFDGMVQSDKEMYEFDLDAYENQLLMYLFGYADHEPWYRPEGYRYAKNLLLTVDEDLLAAYIDLLARYEEEPDAAEAEESAAQDVSAETAAEEPVTAEDVEAAKAAVIASVQNQIDEINAKLAEGVSFDDLMAEYGTDAGMTDGTYPNGYEVSPVSYGFVPGFIAAAFSVDAIGEVSLPYVSEQGVHIVQYTGDVPAGSIELTEAMKAQLQEALYNEQCNDLMNDWYDSADIEYTGALRTFDEIIADDAQ